MTLLSAWWIGKVAIAAIGMVGFLGIGVSVIVMTAQLPPKGMVEKLDTAGLYGTAGSLLAMPIILVLSLFLQTRLPSRPVATKLTHKDEEKGELDTPLPQPVPAQGDEDTASNENGAEDGSNGEEESGRYSEITSGDGGAPDVRPSVTSYEESPAESDSPRHVMEHVPASFLPLRSQRPSYSYYTSPYSGTDQRGSRRNQQHRLNASKETRLGVRSADESSPYSFYTTYPSYQEVDDQEIPAPTQVTTHQDVHDQDETRNSIAKPGTQPINAGYSDDSYWVHTDIGLAIATPPLTFLSPHQEAHNQELSEGDMSSDNFYPSIQDMVQYYPTTGQTEDKVTDRINQTKQLSKSTNRNSHRTFDLAKTGVTADLPVKKPCMVNKRVGTDPESQPWIFTTGGSSTRLNEDGFLVHKWVEPVSGAGIATPKKVRFQIDDDESSECEFETAESSPDGKKECLKIGEATGVKFKQ